MRPLLPAILPGGSRASERACVVYFAIWVTCSVGPRRVETCPKIEHTHTETHTHAQQQQLHMLLAPRTSCLMVKCKQPTAGCILAKPQAHTHSNTSTHSPTHTDTHQSTHTHQHQHRQACTFTNASSTCPHSRIATNKKKVSKYINI